jgi:hypothetical protein
MSFSCGVCGKWLSPGHRCSKKALMRIDGEIRPPKPDLDEKRKEFFETRLDDGFYLLNLEESRG